MLKSGIISLADVNNIEKHFMKKWERPLTKKELKERLVAIKYGTYTGILEKKGAAYQIPEDWKMAIRKLRK